MAFFTKKPTRAAGAPSQEALEAEFRSLVASVPTRAPIFLPTEAISLSDRVAGMRKVKAIYDTGLDAVYRPRLSALRDRYRGTKRCFVIGNGPSLNATDLALLKDEVTFAVNGFFLKARELGWQPTFYVVEDHLVAEDRREWINALKGPIKLFPAYLGYCLDEADDTIFFNHRPRKSFPHGFDFSSDAESVTFAGCTVTFTALQLAFYLGFEEIYLIGVDADYDIPKDVQENSGYGVGVLDMKSDDPNHFHPDYFGKGFRWHDPQVHKMVEAYSEARRAVEKTTQRIYNATVGGKLEVFERRHFSALFPHARSAEALQAERSEKEHFRRPAVDAPLKSAPRLLMIDLTRCGDGTATGELKANLFSGWPQDRLLQVYHLGGGRLGCSPTGTRTESRSDVLDVSTIAKAVDSFRPELILYRPVPDAQRLHVFAMETIKRLDVPLVTWIMDDWPARLEVDDPEQFANLDNDWRQLLACSAVRLSIGEAMSKAFEERYGGTFCALANGVDPADWPRPRMRPPGRFVLRYAGSLADNMTLQSVERIAQAVQQLAQSGHDIGFEIKTGPIWAERVRPRFAHFGSVSFHTNYLSPQDYRAWISEADVVVIAYNFDEISRRYVRYSIANKMPECLASGAAVLAHGPRGVATIDYLAESKAALVVDAAEPARLEDVLLSLKGNPFLRLDLADAAQRIAFTKHRLDDLKTKLGEVLAGALTSKPLVRGALTYHHRGTFVDRSPLPKDRGLSRTLIILGNGPSLKGFDFKRLEAFDAIGMNAAYRFWDQIGWYPRYYICLDKVVGLSHRDQIRRLIEERDRNGIELFVLRRNLIDDLPPEVAILSCVWDFDAHSAATELLSVMPITTGSHAALVGALLGYERMVLMGVDCNYVEKVDGAEQRDGTVLELTRTPQENANYFFDGYQVAGDRYNIPNPTPELHLESWRAVAPVLAARGIAVWNASRISRVDAFPKRDFDDIEHEDALAHRSMRLPPSRSPAVYLREAHARVDETKVVSFLLADRGGADHVMLDVGAHVGTSAGHFDRLGWTIHCFEPDASNRRQLTARFGGKRNIRIDPRAVSDAPATGVSFFTSQESSGISALHAFHNTHVESDRVDVTTVAAIIDEYRLTRLDFLKIDVEGFDFAVLKGVPWDTLAPDVIECEFEDAKTIRLGHGYKEICDYLAARGYAVYLSEWHPITRYGIAHDWRQVVRFPTLLATPDAWGNILAFKVDPGLDAIRAAFANHVDVAKPGALGGLRERSFPTESPSASPAPPVRHKATGAQPSTSGKKGSSEFTMPLYTRIALWAEANNRGLFRLGQFVMWSLRTGRRHLGPVLLALTAFCALLIGSLLPAMIPYRLWFILAAVVMALVGLLGLAAGFAKQLAKDLQAAIRAERQREMTAFRREMADLRARGQALDASTLALTRRLEDLSGEFARRLTAAETRTTQAVEQFNKATTALPANLSGFQRFNRTLRPADAETLANDWSRLLSVPISVSTLAYMAHRACTLESMMQGRLATSIETMLLRVMVALSVKRRDISIVEIGTLFGAGAAILHDAIVAHFERVRLTLIDPLSGYYGSANRDILTGQPVSEAVLRRNLRVAGVPDDDVTLIKHLSTDADAVRAVSGRSFDVLIIDGDHTYAGVKADFETYISNVRQGGFVVFDDYGSPDWPDIQRYVDAEVAPLGNLVRVGDAFRTSVWRVARAPVGAPYVTSASDTVT